MICGSIYIKLLPKKKNLRYLKYCHLIKTLPIDFQSGVDDIVNYINNKYSDYMIVPMVATVHPGCIVQYEYTKEIAKDLYDVYNKFMMKYTKEECVRCVCTIGEVDRPYQSNDIGTAWGESLIRLGHYLDLSDEIGLFTI